MTGEIGYFDAENIWERGGLLLGGKAERENTVNYLLGQWNHNAGESLVVLDPDGRLYARYGGRGLLVDLASANSAIPDVYTPILNHLRYGRTPALSAKLIADVVIREKQDRTSNDAFWSQSGRQLIEEYIAYGLLLSHLYRRSGMSTGSVTLDFGLAHEYLSGLMRKFISCGVEETDRWRPPSERTNRPVDFTRAKLDAPCPLTNEETEFQDVLAYFYGDGNIPFGDTLAVYSKNSQTATTSSVLKTGQAMGRHLFDLNQRLYDEDDYYEKLARVDMEKFVSGGEDGEKNIIFIVNGVDRNIASTSALLTLLGCATAADECRRRVTCLIPDISVWDVFDGILKITEIFPKALRCVIGCGDFIRAARRTDMSAVAYFDRLSGITGENIVWHKSNDEFLKQAFKERSSGLSLMYGLSDLGGNGLAAAESNGDFQYLYIPETDDTGTAPAAREEYARNAATQRSLWYYFDTHPHLELTEQEEEQKDDKKLGKINHDMDRQIEEIWGTSGSEN
ncbi:hypothetical protein [uncultured Cloacibacillus sp.]|uniref:hypothetical protein n=1 Tax=uncultured Cloacibacillus sp. TaxID=889794 RepID=UPI0026DD795B|nr:hypothetical protein [uncultured Cloacibacillus sp.]